MSIMSNIYISSNTSKNYGVSGASKAAVSATSKKNPPDRPIAGSYTEGDYLKIIFQEISERNEAFKNILSAIPVDLGWVQYMPILPQMGYPQLNNKRRVELANLYLQLGGVQSNYLQYALDRLNEVLNCPEVTRTNGNIPLYFDCLLGMASVYLAYNDQEKAKKVCGRVLNELKDKKIRDRQIVQNYSIPGYEARAKYLLACSMLPEIDRPEVEREVKKLLSEVVNWGKSELKNTPKIVMWEKMGRVRDVRYLGASAALALADILANSSDKDWLEKDLPLVLTYCREVLEWDEVGKPLARKKDEEGGLLDLEARAILIAVHAVLRTNRLDLAEKYLKENLPLTGMDGYPNLKDLGCKKLEEENDLTAALSNALSNVYGNRYLSGKAELQLAKIEMLKENYEPALAHCRKVLEDKKYAGVKIIDVKVEARLLIADLLQRSPDIYSTLEKCPPNWMKDLKVKNAQPKALNMAMAIYDDLLENDAYRGMSGYLKGETKFQRGVSANVR
jgi:hypothetical protein